MVNWDFASALDLVKKKKKIGQVLAAKVADPMDLTNLKHYIYKKNKTKDLYR